MVNITLILVTHLIMIVSTTSTILRPMFNLEQSSIVYASVGEDVILGCQVTTKYSQV